MSRYHKYRPELPSCRTITSQKLCFCFLFIVLWFFCCFNTDNVDYIDGYYIPYIHLERNFFEMGYKLLNVVFHGIGVNFFIFRMLMMTVTLLLLSNSILAYCKAPATALTLYLIYPFFIECVQIRNAMSAALIIFGIRYLFRDTGKGILKYIFFVAAAALFHKSALLYLAFIFVYKRPVKKILAGSLYIFAAEYLFLLKAGAQFLQWLYQLSGDGRLLFYMELNDGRLLGKGMLPFLALEAVLIIIYRNKKHQIESGEDFHDAVLFKIAFLTFMFLPLYLLDGNYIRLCTFMLPVFYAVLLNTVQYPESRLLYRIIVRGICFILSGILFAFYIGPFNMSSFDDVTNAVVTNNLVWEWLKR